MSYYSSAGTMAMPWAAVGLLVVAEDGDVVGVGEVVVMENHVGAMLVASIRQAPDAQLRLARLSRLNSEALQDPSAMDLLAALHPRTMAGLGCLAQTVEPPIAQDQVLLDAEMAADLFVGHVGIVGYEPLFPFWTEGASSSHGLFAFESFVEEWEAGELGLDGPVLLPCLRRHLGVGGSDVALDAFRVEGAARHVLEDVLSHFADLVVDRGDIDVVLLAEQSVGVGGDVVEVESAEGLLPLDAASLELVADAGIADGDLIAGTDVDLRHEGHIEGRGGVVGVLEDVVAGGAYVLDGLRLVADDASEVGLYKILVGESLVVGGGLSEDVLHA